MLLLVLVKAVETPEHHQEHIPSSLLEHSCHVAACSTAADDVVDDVVVDGIDVVDGVDVVDVAVVVVVVVVVVGQLRTVFPQLSDLAEFLASLVFVVEGTPLRIFLFPPRCY